MEKGGGAGWAGVGVGEQQALVFLSLMPRVYLLHRLTPSGEVN